MVFVLVDWLDLLFVGIIMECNVIFEYYNYYNCCYNNYYNNYYYNNVENNNWKDNNIKFNDNNGVVNFFIYNCLF